MGIMFYGCINLTTIYASDKFVTTAVEISDNMFDNCKKLVGRSALRQRKGRDMKWRTTKPATSPTSQRPE